MARLTAGQKTHRMLAFLMGLGNREVARALQRYGFGQAALDEGWTLLRQTAAVQLDAPPRQLTREDVERLDAWENQWFPIAGAVLQRHHREVHAAVFHNLRQTRGNEVVLSVSTFVTRIDALAGSGNGEALATLARHGLTEEVLGEARDLLGGVMRPPSVEPSGAEDDELAAAAAAQEAMWAYYLLWSAIARSTISDRRLLRKLGFLRKQRDGEEDAGEDGEAPDSAAAAG
jgi:hypothetical protein